VQAGARDLRISDAQGVFRLMYVAKFEEAVYVLHCFQKKTRATSKQDKAIATALPCRGERKKGRAMKIDTEVRPGAG
jgi:phage-related protein